MVNSFIKYAWLCLSLLSGLITANTFTANDMHNLRRLSSPAVSPDGGFVVYSVRIRNETTGAISSHLQYTNITSGKTLDVTPINEGVTDYNPVFSLNFTHILLFLRNFGGRTHIYYLPFPPKQGDVPTQLTNYPVDIDNLKFQADTLVFSSEVYYECKDLQCSADKNKEVAKRGSNTWQVYTKLFVRHWDRWVTEGKVSHVFVQKVTNNEGNIVLRDSPIDLLQGLDINSPVPPYGGTDMIDISPDGKEISFTGHPRTHDESWNTGWKSYHYNLDTMKSAFSFTQHTKARTQNPRYSKDGTKIGYLAMKRPGLESDNLHLEIYDVLTNKVRNIGDVADRSIIDFTWYDDTTIIYTATDLGVNKLFVMNILSDNATVSVLTSDQFSYSAPMLVPNQDYHIVSRNSFNQPDDLAVFKFNKTETKAEITPLTRINADKLSNFTFSTAESFTYQGGYGDEVQGWIMKPTTFEETKKYPLAFLIHGGPESAWESSWSYRWNPQLWTNAGYVVVMINPHGSVGMGIKFQDAVRNNWGGTPFEDLMTGLAYVLQTYSFIDKDRMCAAGGSYGGYMINWIQGQDHPFQCLVTHDGVFSTLSMFYATEEMWFPYAEYCAPENMGCAPYESENSRLGYVRYSPESYIRNWKTPHLVIHGGNDYRIPISEGTSLFTALQLKNIPSKFVYFPEENHWVLRAENSIKWYEEVLAWMDKYTKESEINEEIVRLINLK